MFRALALFAALLTFAPSVASADDFVIPPPWYSGTDGAQISAGIVNALQATLTPQDRVILPADAVQNLPKDQRTWCASGECAERYRKAAKATAAIVIRVYRLGTSGPATSFQIGLQPEPGLEYIEGAILDARPLAEQVADVWIDVQRKYRRGPGPHLNVTGAPKAAEILVDGRPMGHLPEFLTLTVGTHQVAVRARGFETQTHVVALQSAASFEELEIRLEPARVRPRTASAPKPQRQQEPPPEAPKLAIGLGSAGAAALVGGSLLAGWALTEDGGCSKAGPFCTEPREHETNWAAAGAGIGISAIGIGAIVWGALQYRKDRRRPTVRVEANRTDTTVYVRGNF